MCAVLPSPSSSSALRAPACFLIKSLSLHLGMGPIPDWTGDQERRVRDGSYSKPAHANHLCILQDQVRTRGPGERLVRSRGRLLRNQGPKLSWRQKSSRAIPRTSTAAQGNQDAANGPRPHRVSTPPTIPLRGRDEPCLGAGLPTGGAGHIPHDRHGTGIVPA